MSLQAQISSLATRIGTEFKTLRGTLGANSALTTTAKDTLVNAINEIKAQENANGTAAANAATINDASTSSTTQTWSASKSTSAIAAAVSNLVNAAPTTLDTLGEIATQLASDESAATALTTAVGNRLRFDAAQTLTGPQQTQGQTNLSVYSQAQIGDPTTDFVAVFVAALS